MHESSQTGLEETLLIIEQYACQFLSQGRKDWDEPHTRSVVYYARKIATAEGADVLVAASAAWLHDIGYFGLFEGDSSKQHAEIKARKEQHMIRGAQMSQELFARPEMQRRVSTQQAERIVHLVKVHDEVEKLSALDEVIMMEADTLGAIDVTRVRPTFNYANAMRYMEGLTQRRIPRFITTTGRDLAANLLPKFEAYVQTLSTQ